ncbi:MAG: TetR/AcrR family transcriptional regulator [candidate division KSB1 bacterium]|nr:TetR/AcrR family transcriptional regulator [candidate division KSB1 bacterium]
MGVRERQEREREARLEAIRQAALRLFAEKGFAGTSMEDIAAAAELGKGTVYYYFPSKEALLEDILDTYTGRYFQHLSQAIRDQDDLFSVVEKVLLGYVDFHQENPHFLRLHHRWVTDGVREARVQLERFRQRYRELRAPLEQQLRDRARREFSGRLNPEVIVNLVGGLLLVYGSQLQRGTRIDEVREYIGQTLILLRLGFERLKSERGSISGGEMHRQERPE